MPQNQALKEIIKQEVLADLNRTGNHNRPQQELVASIKADVLAEIEAEQEAAENRGFANTAVPYTGSYTGSKLSPGERDLIKWEIMRDLNSGDLRPARAVDKAVVDNIKHELLAELEANRYGRSARTDGWRDILSDRSIDRRINQQYSDLRTLRSEIRRGLQAVQDTERRLDSIADPLVRDAVSTILRETRQEGIPLNQVINRLSTDGGRTAGFGQRVANWFGPGAGRGFLGGLGVSLLAALLVPATRGSLRNVGIRVMESSMDFADQTRSAFGKAREGFEDMIAEANFNTLQDHDEFPTEVLDPPITNEPEGPPDDYPSH